MMDKTDVEYIRLEKAKKNGRTSALEQMFYCIREIDEEFYKDWIIRECRDMN